MKITVEKLIIAQNVANQFKNSMTKFGYACLKSSKLIKDTLEDVLEEISDKKNELASVDKDGNIVLNEKSEYVYTSENFNKLKKFISNQYKKEVDYNPFFASDYSEIKNQLEVLDVLNGVIIDIDLEKQFESIND